jgi:hypothetical protein
VHLLGLGEHQQPELRGAQTVAIPARLLPDGAFAAARYAPLPATTFRLAEQRKLRPLEPVVARV